MTIFERAMINDFKYFKELEYDPDLKDESGKSLLHYAVLGSSFEVINELIKVGANVNILDLEGETPLFDCARKAKVEIAKILIINYAKVNLTNNKGETPFHLASSKGDKTFIQLLVENNALANVLTNNKQYPVHYAILAGKIDIIKTLLSLSNQSFLLFDEKKNSLLHYATQTTNDLMIYFLISEGLNPNLLNDNYETPLFNAVRFGTKETVTALLNNDAYIDIKNRHKESPEEYALVYNRYELQTLLVNYQMLPKYERLLRNQAITVATLNRDLQLVLKLLNNSKAMRYDKYNFSALDYAKMYNFTEIAKVLKNCPIV